MSNTQLRIFSALVLVALVALMLYLGTTAALVFVGVASLLVIDEILINFFGQMRSSKRYASAHLLFLAPYVFFHFIEVMPGLFSVFINAGVLLNLVFLAYLFGAFKNEKKYLTTMARYPFLAAAIVLFPIMSLTSLFHDPNWIRLLVVLLLINFGMDTGAWFFGKNFGKHKLWEAVSPKKTIEGFIGGIFVSAVLGAIFWFVFFEQISAILIALFALLGAISQLGDLVQSKLKRQFEIKDSSALIPGHGGVYDRLDSLLFMAPFYAAAVNVIYLN